MAHKQKTAQKQVEIYLERPPKLKWNNTIVAIRIMNDNKIRDKRDRDHRSKRSSGAMHSVSLQCITGISISVVTNTGNILSLYIVLLP
jgi:hypothetical protein